METKMSTPTKADITTNKIQFCFQLLIIFVIITTSLCCIIRQNGNITLWTTLLGVGLGYALPSPKLKEKPLIGGDLFQAINGDL